METKDVGDASAASPTGGELPICIVSFQLPAVYDAAEGWQRNSSSLVNDVATSLRGTRAHWYGFATHREPPPPSGDLSLHTIVVHRTEIAEAIEGFADRTLWPALHGLRDNIEVRDSWWSAYEQLSDRVARMLANQLPVGTSVWMHGRHFLGVPRLLRELRPDLQIGVFCHTAVDGDTMATLSSAVELARRVAAADVIGVQTDADAVSVQRMLAASGLAHDDLPEIHVEPVGIDTEAWLRQLDDPVVAALSSKLRLPGGVLAVGVDHLHYSAGVIHKLLAIETLLESGALGADDLRLVQIALPTSLAGPTHRFLQSQLEEIATRINGAHRRSDGLDVIDIVSSPPSPRELAALYRAADIALVTPVRDGFNRVAVEYSLANHDRPCVLILSDGTGTSHHLGWHCVTVDASDVLAIAAALRRVIADPDSPDRGSAERRAAVARSLDSTTWVTRCLDRLAGAAGVA